LTASEDLAFAIASQDPEERRRATAALADHSAEEVLELLRRALGDEDWRVRKEATDVAIRLRSDAVVRFLVETLGPTDENIGRRNAAVEALAGYGARCVDALSVVIPALDADGRKLAAEALGRCGQDSALIVLKSMTRDVDPNVRVAVVEAMATVGATSVDVVAPILDSYLDSDDPLLRLTALTGLNDLGVAIEWPRLVSSLDDPVLRRAALVAAGRRADPEAAPVLVSLLERARGSTYDTVLAALVDFLRAGPQSLEAAREAAAGLSEDARSRVYSLARTGDPVELRRRAVLLLGALATEDAARVATRALADDTVAAEAEETIEVLGPLAAGPLLDRIAEGPSPDRAVCIDLVGQLASPAHLTRTVGVLRGSLDDASEEVVAVALTVLAALGDASCLEPAAQLLGAHASLTRRAAAQAVAGIAKRHAADALKLVRGTTPDGPDAHAAALVIGVLDGPVLGDAAADIAFLSEALSHDDAGVRRAAIDALAGLHSDSAVETVAFALTDEEPAVRAAAVRALGRMRSEAGDATGVDSLLGLVERSEDDELVAAATRALGDTGDSRALTKLRDLIRSGKPAVAVSAVDAVAKIAHPERIDAVVEGIWHDDPEVVKAALQRLAEENASSRSHLTACLDHDAWDVRRLAADLLGRHGGEGTMARLRHRLAREQEPLVREAIQRALVEIEASTAGIRRTTSPPLRGSSNH
jgi:HEAT repeat protein